MLCFECNILSVSRAFLRNMSVSLLSVSDFADSLGVPTYCLKTVGTIIGNDVSHINCKFLGRISRRFEKSVDFFNFVVTTCRDCFEEHKPLTSEAFTRLVAAKLSLCPNDTEALVAEIKKYDYSHTSQVQAEFPFDWKERELSNLFESHISVITGSIHIYYITCYKRSYSVKPLNCIFRSQKLIMVALAQILKQKELIFYGYEEFTPFKETISVDSFEKDLVFTN